MIYGVPGPTGSGVVTGCPHPRAADNERVEELIAFLRARLDEEEAAAEAVLSAAKLFSGAPQRSTPLGHQVFDGSGIVVTHDRTVVLPSDVAAHIAIHDPGSAIAEAKAWRRILLEYSIPPGTDAVYGGTERETGFRIALRFTLKCKYLTYDRHPGYREELLSGPLA